MTCQQEGCTRKGELACMVGEVPTVKAAEVKAKASDVDTAKILLNIARNLAADQPDIQLMLDAAIMVLR